MNAQEYYEFMKEALRVFGLRWGEMDKMTLSIDGQRLVLSYKNLEFGVHLDTTED